MRKNIFLHFMNRDSREIFGLFEGLGQEQHYLSIKSALNAAVLLCEEYCIMPPGFAVEDEIAFELLGKEKELLQRRLIQFPMRESSLADFAEKKRSEYSPMRGRYSGLFDDRRIEFLGKNAAGLIGRKSQIGQKIVSGWASAADSSRGLWGKVKLILPPKTIELIRLVPDQLAAEGTAVTWEAISKSLPSGALAAKRELRDSLQNIYFRQYCQEFGLYVLSKIPFMLNTFGLRTSAAYDFHLLSNFLDAFELKEFLLNGSGFLISEIKRNRGLTDLMDVYSQLAGQKSAADTIYFAQAASLATGFDWKGFAARNHPLLGEPTTFALTEVLSAMSETSSHLAAQHGLTLRSDALARPKSNKIVRGADPLSDVVLYVALEEELEVLVDTLKLTKNYKGAAASGKLANFDVEVLCPRAMGRVVAAVEVASYLQLRKDKLPKLILMVGLAGGFKAEGSEPGHTINVTTVVDLAQRKVTDRDEGGVDSKLRRKDFNLNQGLYKVLSSHSFDTDRWIADAIKEADWPRDRRPSLHSGAVASGDEVVSSEEWQKKLTAYGDKLLGVEMEAGGVCEAAERFKVPVSMLRVVSDNADPSKADDAWRKTGMRTLAILLRQLPVDLVLDAL